MRDDRSIWKRKPVTATAWLVGWVSAWGLGIYAFGWVGRGGADRWLGRAEAATPAPPPPVQTVDGDTIRVRGETLRIANIDAPETGARADCWAEARLGVEASAFMRHAIGPDELQTFTFTRTGVDRYGRTLARVSVNGEDLGERMIAVGLAAPWTGARWDWCGPVDSRAPGAADLAQGIRQYEAFSREVLSPPE